MSNKITKQEAFNNVWQHFVVEENPPSLASDGMRCMYRMDDGRACAIGIMIPDEMYDPEMEGAGCASALFEEFPSVATLFEFAEQRFADELQGCHDNAAANSIFPFERTIKRNLVDLAYRYNLTVPDAEAPA